jgi:hypothetical protein
MSSFLKMSVGAVSHPDAEEVSEADLGNVVDDVLIV